MTLEGRIKRLERERDYPANPGPDPETVELWASLWTAAGLEESRAKAAAPEFLAHCQTAEQTATIAALNKWAHCESVGLTLRWMQRYDKSGLYKGYNRVQLEPLQLTTTFCPTLWSHLCSQQGQGRHVISLRVLPTVQLGPGRALEGGRPSHRGQLG